MEGVKNIAELSPVKGNSEDALQVVRHLLAVAEIYGQMLMTSDPGGARRPPILAELEPVLAWLVREMDGQPGTPAQPVAQACLALCQLLQTLHQVRGGNVGSGPFRRAVGALWDGTSTLKHALVLAPNPETASLDL